MKNVACATVICDKINDITVILDINEFVTDW